MRNDGDRGVNRLVTRPATTFPAAVAFVVGLAACNARDVDDGALTPDAEADGDADDVPEDLPPEFVDVPEDAVAHDDAEVPEDAAADGETYDRLHPRPPLYGECVPGRRRCSADLVYVEMCDAEGRWLPWKRCDVSHIVGPIRNALDLGFWCNEPCNPYEVAYCGHPNDDGHNGGCQAGRDWPFLDPSGIFGETSCDDDGDELILPVLRGSLCPRRPEDAYYERSCVDSPLFGLWTMGMQGEYRISCPCEEGVMVVPEGAGSRIDHGPWPFGACTDSGLGSPGSFGDESTRATRDILGEQFTGYDGLCNEPGAFPSGRSRLCLPRGCGYCWADDHCNPGERCRTEQCIADSAACALSGWDYAYCVPE